MARPAGAFHQSSQRPGRHASVVDRPADQPHHRSGDGAMTQTAAITIDERYVRACGRLAGERKAQRERTLGIQRPHWSVELVAALAWLRWLNADQTRQLFAGLGDAFTAAFCAAYEAAV